MRGVCKHKEGLAAMGGGGRGLMEFGKRLGVNADSDRNNITR